MIRWWTLGLVLALSACGAEEADPDALNQKAQPTVTTTTAADATTTTTATKAPEPEVVTLSAAGEQNTDPFTLSGGSYAVTFDFGGECYYSGDLRPITGEAGLPEQVGTGDGPVKGTTNVYDIEAGDYFIAMITGPAPSCPWSITLSRR